MANRRLYSFWANLSTEALLTGKPQNITRTARGATGSRSLCRPAALGIMDLPCGVHSELRRPRPNVHFSRYKTLAAMSRCERASAGPVARRHSTTAVSPRPAPFRPVCATQVCQLPARPGQLGIGDFITDALPSATHHHGQSSPLLAPATKERLSQSLRTLPSRAFVSDENHTSTRAPKECLGP